MQTFIVSNYLFPSHPAATIEDVVEFCNSRTILGLDIETSRKYKKGTYDEEIYKPGLDPYVSRIVMIQIGDLTEKRFVIDTRCTDITKLLPVLKDESKLFVGHNLKFEYKFLLVHYGVRLRRIYDTMLGEMNINNGREFKFSLEALSERYL